MCKSKESAVFAELLAEVFPTAEERVAYEREVAKHQACGRRRRSCTRRGDGLGTGVRTKKTDYWLLSVRR